jgi:hypothetical protein
MLNGGIFCNSLYKQRLYSEKTNIDDLNFPNYSSGLNSLKKENYYLRKIVAEDMKLVSILFLNLALNISVSASRPITWKTKSENAEYLHLAIKQMTDIIVHDIYSPPVASRIYAYITIAAYEAAAPFDQSYQTLAGQLHDFQKPPLPGNKAEVCYSLAAVHALLLVGKTMVISEPTVNTYHQKLLKEFRRLGIPSDVYNRTLIYGKKVAEYILDWASKDNYAQTRSYPKYQVTDDDATWKPTPPAYIKAVEPDWNKIRPFVIDSAQQFKPLPATPFSPEKQSKFYKEALEVQQAGLNINQEQITIANFWDCNPFKMNTRGHVMFATKKISPGGHWINITRLACNKAKASFTRSAAAYACVSITLADAFISCWDEKYRSNVIRPETYINQYIDPSWVPLLQTPPFPEYTSGHSVISTASAIMLSFIFGKNFSFADSSELEYGLPVRQFTSFNHAAEEAAMSRFFGGIHYLPSIKNGVEEGNNIGNFISSKLRVLRQNNNQPR